MESNETYFDPVLNKVGEVQKTADGEVWFHSSDGTDSRALNPGEFLIPYPTFAALIASIMGSMDKFRPALGQGSDSVCTENVQNTDSGHTDSGQVSEKADSAQNARNFKRPPATTAQICKAYKDVCVWLKNGGNIKRVSEGVYSSFKDLPKNCPEYIVDALNAAGFRQTNGKVFTRDTASSILNALKIESRPNKWRVLYLIALAVLISVGVTKVIQPKQSEGTHNQTEVSNFDFDANKIDLICSKLGIQITDYRKKLILAKNYNSEEELINEIKAHYSAMVEVMSKQK